ncbi:MAG: head-tail connector protein [Acetobacter peroxydans]|jgi:hypothetical protein|nr:head-tail connector protein [Acetobacter peroxydans]
MPTTLVLRIKTPPQNPALDLLLAKQHLRIDHDEDDALLGMYIKAASSWVEKYTGRALVTTEYTMAVGDQPIANAWPMTPSPLLILPLAYSWPPMQPRPMRLLRAPFLTFGGIDVIAPDGTQETLSPTEYRVDAASEPANFRLTGSFGLLHGRHLLVTFTAGYGETSASIPCDIQLALCILVAYFYENRGDMSMDAMPDAAASLLFNHRLVWFGA